MGDTNNIGPSIAIVPFENLTSDNDLQVLCEGFTYDIIMELSKFSQFQIISLESYSITSKPEDYESILGKTDYHIKGSFRSTGDKVRINAQLIETGTKRLVWADKLENTLEAFFEIEEELLLKIVATLQEKLDIDLLSKVRRKDERNFKAYELWLYGLHELKKGTLESDQEARRYFEQAIELDPMYSLAYTGMSLSYFNEWSCQIWDQWDVNQSGAKKWALKALELDQQNYLANLIAGRISLFEYEFDKAETQLHKAALLNPNDPFNLVYIADSYVYLGNLKQAEELYQKAINLRPFQKEDYHPYGAHLYFEKGEYEKCIELGEKYVDTAWVDYPCIIAACYYYLGDTKKAKLLWGLFLKKYKEKIGQGLDNLEKSALEWTIKYNPYKKETRFTTFWDFMAIEKNLEVDMDLSQDEQTPKQNSLYKEGDIWTFTYLNSSVQLTHSKGLQDIATLLAYPNTEFHCSELIGGGIVEKSNELVDEQARKEYQNKVVLLQQEIKEAESLNDYQSLERLQDEYDELIDHLSKVFNVKGKPRKFQSTDDKARSAVTQRIRGSIKKIEDVHPSLGAHLHSTIKTGSFCSYAPTVKIEWEC